MQCALCYDELQLRARVWERGRIVPNLQRGETPDGIIVSHDGAMKVGEVQAGEELGRLTEV